MEPALSWSKTRRVKCTLKLLRGKGEKKNLPCSWIDAHGRRGAPNPRAAKPPSRLDPVRPAFTDSHPQSHNYTIDTCKLQGRLSAADSGLVDANALEGKPVSYQGCNLWLLCKGPTNQRVITLLGYLYTLLPPTQTTTPLPSHSSLPANALRLLPSTSAMPTHRSSSPLNPSPTTAAGPASVGLP